MPVVIVNVNRPENPSRLRRGSHGAYGVERRCFYLLAPLWTGYARNVLPKELAILKLDVDRMRKPSASKFAHLLSRAGHSLLSVAYRRSPGGKGWHVWLEVEPRPRSMVEVIALQAILGSDPMREAVTLMRARGLRRTPRWAWEWANVLYAPDKARSRRIRLSSCLKSS